MNLLGSLSHFSHDRTYVDREARLVLVLNPKVGTTFLRDALADGLREFRGMTDPSEGRYRLFTNPRKFPIARVRDYLAFLRRPQDFSFYAFVRNPYARLYSAWKDKFYNGHHNGYPRAFKGHRLRAMRAFARKRGLPGGENGTLVPFETFVESVLEGEIGRMNHHWDAQYSVLSMDYFRYARLFRIEDERDLGLQEVLGRLGFARDWIAARAGQARNTSGADRPVEYTQDMADAVYEKFRRDFETFGYARGSWRA
jgi:hypothetical protein